jgi:hypothetical protein
MRLLRWAAAAAAPAVLLTGLFSASPARATVARPGTPARIYPNKDCLAPTVPLYGGAMWDTTVGLPPQAWLGIANWGANTQNSAAGGPGTAYNYDDAVTITSAQQEGTPIMGYIATGYGTSASGYTQADIEAQMTDWSSWYGVTKFFFAQVPTATTYRPYYAALKNWAHAHIGSSSRVWLEMGGYPAASSWMNDASVIMDWEGGTAPAAPPSWVYNYKSDRFAMIMNAVPDTASAIAAAVAAMEGSHAGHGFVTSDPTYQMLPSWAYWTTFANDAALGCR